MGQLGEGKMTGKGLASFGRWGKLGGEEEEKGKSWEHEPVFGLLLADRGESEAVVVKRTVRGSLVCEEEER